MKPVSTQFSPYGHASMTPSPVNRMMAQVAADFRDDVDINLGVGYVNEATIPRSAINRAVEAVLADPTHHRLALNYGGPAGSPNLTAALERYYRRRRPGGLKAEQLARLRFVVGANGATSLLESLGQLFAPGVVVTADPRYYIYCDYLERLGYRVLSVPEGPDGLEANAVAERLDGLGDGLNDLRFFYVVTISNPTCTIMSGANRGDLVELARRIGKRLGRPLPVIFDKAYEELIHDPNVEAPRSGLATDTTGVAYEIGTLSKIVAPGLRLGYLLGPPGEIVDALVQRTSDIGFSAPLFNQEIGGRLLDEAVDAQIEQVNAGYRHKATYVRRWLDELLGAEIETLRGGSAGFYYYLTLRDVETGIDSPLFRYATRTTGDMDVDGPTDAREPRVIYLPGEYCVAADGELRGVGNRQMRISYGFEELPRLRAALEILRGGVAWARTQRSSAVSAAER